MEDPTGFRPIFTIGEETDAMREASVAIMNGMTYSEMRIRYESKGNIKSSSTSAIIGSSIDNIAGAVAGKFIKNATVKTVSGLIGAGWRHTSTTFHGAAPYIRNTIGAIGTTAFFIYNSIGVLNKYGWSWQGGGKRVFVDGIWTGLATVTGVALLSSAALPVAILGGAAIGLVSEGFSRLAKMLIFKDSFWS